MAAIQGHLATQFTYPGLQKTKRTNARYKFKELGTNDGQNVVQPAETKRMD